MRREAFQQQKRYLGGPAASVRMFGRQPFRTLPHHNSHSLLQRGSLSAAVAPVVLRKLVLPVATKRLVVARQIG